ncbi:conserved hypothetical protein [Desulfosarcina cetonica]|uniref:PqiC family protein n=1 Tax=Desulfosarcina cetonica TaxID=90730 RepID=UPI0006CF2ADD|nr:PqiC family protein [Desulfosarcina cetonica]VTR64307.1 conserved hypothetical protein [Desulfosarcina cetonica]
MMRIRSWWMTGLALLTGLTCGCCALSPPVNYYTLSAIAAPAIGVDDQNVARPLMIGIQPVDLPGYINRLQMVTRSGANRVSVSGLNRWADYPDRMVQQTIVENLQRLMPHARVLNSPWPSAIKPNIILSVQFFELIGTADGQVSLGAVWNLSGGEAVDGAEPHRTVLVEPMAGHGFDALAAAHSRVIGSLCQSIAEAVKKDGLVKSPRSRLANP